jgi:hypothetical protein
MLPRKPLSWIGISAACVAALGIVLLVVFYDRARPFTHGRDEQNSSRGQQRAATKQSPAVNSGSNSSEDVTAAKVRERVANRTALMQIPPFSQALGDPDTSWVILRLLQSSDANDWYRASVLNTLCAMTAVDPPKVGSVSKPSEIAFLANLERSRRHCGEAGLTVVPMGGMGLIAKAKNAGGTLATLPFISGRAVREEGLSKEQGELLSKALSSSDSFPVEWLVGNQTALLSSITRAGTYDAAGEKEMISAFYLSLCGFLASCDRPTLLDLKICTETFTSVCGAESISRTLADSFSTDQLQRIRSVSTQISNDIRSGNLAKLGLKIKTET